MDARRAACCWRMDPFAKPRIHRAKRKNYYEILDLERECSAKDIKSSFISLSKKYHPDLCGNTKEANENYANLVEAYETLSNPYKRREYDRAQSARGTASNAHNFRTHTYRNEMDADSRPYFYKRGKEKNSRYNFIFRNSLAPNAALLAFLVLLIAGSSIRYTILRREWNKEREAVKRRSAVANVFLEYSRRQAATHSWEERMEMLKNGTLNNFNMEDIIAEVDEGKKAD